MERNELKQLFETMEERTMRIWELADFLNVLASNDLLGDTGKFLYIITDILYKECDKLDFDRTKLKSACLD